MLLELPTENSQHFHYFKTPTMTSVMARLTVHFRTWFNGHSGVKPMVGFNDLKGLFPFQLKRFCDSVNWLFELGKDSNI